MADDNKNTIRQFLDRISQLESSGGKNFNHPTIEAGIQEGTSAAGRYALMPNTINEVLNRMRLQGTITPELKQLQKLDPDQLKTTIETNPQLENQIAEALAQRVLERQQGDEEKAAYSWNQGHNLTPEQISQRPYQEHDYVKKYRSLIKGNEEK